MVKVEAIFRPERLDEVQHELEAIGITGMTVTEVRGAGRQAGYVERYRGLEYKVRLLSKVKIEVVVDDTTVPTVVQAIQTGARTGEVGDGKIFLTKIDDVIRIRTGEAGGAAI